MSEFMQQNIVALLARLHDIACFYIQPNIASTGIAFVGIWQVRITARVSLLIDAETQLSAISSHFCERQSCLLLQDIQNITQDLLLLCIEGYKSSSTFTARNWRLRHETVGNGCG